MNAQELLDSVEIEYTAQERLDRTISDVCKGKTARSKRLAL